MNNKDKAAPSSKDESVKQASKSIGYNVILQLSMRIITFSLNSFIIRFVDRSSLGVINVR